MCGCLYFTFRFSHNTVQAAETSYFKGLHVKSGVFAKLSDVVSAVNADISFADKVSKRHFDIVTEPSYCCGIHGHITKHQYSAGTKHTADAVKKILRIRVVVKAFAANNHIEGIFLKRQIFTVSHNNLHIFQSLSLGDFYHFRRQVNACVVLIGYFSCSRVSIGPVPQPQSRRSVNGSFSSYASTSG